MTKFIDKYIKLKMVKTINYRIFLNQILEQKRSRNPAYTIGAFGRMLGVESSRMSQILNGKVGISVKRALDFANILKLSEYDTKIFILLVQVEHERNPKKREEARKEISELVNEYHDISDLFSSISDWYHHAIVELIGLNNPELTVELIAKKIGVSIEIIRGALERLITFELIEVVPNSFPIRYSVIHSIRRTRQDIPSDAIIMLNEQILEKAAYEIRQQEILQRDYSILFLKFNKDQMEKMKEKIKNFRREILNEFEVSPNKDSVYCMSIQFFDLTGKGNEDI